MFWRFRRVRGLVVGLTSSISIWVVPVLRARCSVAAGVEITVADDGAGISAEDRARVLKRFVRLERSRSRPGTGLGLSLVAAVARLHGGELRLEDNAPGLRVVLVLPQRAGS